MRQKIINSLKLLRIPFSLFLLPVTLFSFYYIKPEANVNLYLVLFIWHLLVYPSSNAYNSYHDKDTGPIGGLKQPPQPTYLIKKICNAFDLLAILLSLLINIKFTMFVAVYILFSRLYSNRSVRLKQYPLTSFFLVFLFQGGWIFMANLIACNKEHLLTNQEVQLSAIASSFFIGTIYPLTQIYQHETDAKDGVKTISILLGVRGTFIFSSIMFALAATLIYFAFKNNPNHQNNFLLFNLIMLPASLYFLFWAKKSFENRAMINFGNTMVMVVLSSVLNNIYFIILLFNQ